MIRLIPTVTVVDGQPRVSSLDIAEKFGKRHDKVLEAIRRVISDLPVSFRLPNFGESSYVNEQGKEQPCYHLTRDGFSLLAMGFTGKKALVWKVKYIEAFNAMEEELLKTRAAALESPEERKRRLGRERLRRFRERKRERKALLAVTEDAGCAPKRWTTLPKYSEQIGALAADAEQKTNECIKALSDLSFALLARPVCLDPEVSRVGKVLERNLASLSFAAQTSARAFCDMAGAYLSGLTAQE